jgi:glutaredoxin
MASVKVYGANWCGMTNRTRAHLESRNVQYEYIDIERDPEAAKWVAAQNNGKEKKPTLDIDGQVLTAPTNNHLDEVLRAKGIV